jgi:hypothetical protein
MKAADDKVKTSAASKERENMKDADFCESHCPVCTRARNGNKLAKLFVKIEMALTFGGCPAGRARKKKYGVRPDEPLPTGPSDRKDESPHQ